MRTLSSFLGLLSLGAGCALGQLHLTPQMQTIELDGPSIRRVYFREGNKKVAVTLSPGVEVAPGENGARFGFKDLPSAVTRWQKSTLSPAVLFTPEQLPKYAAAARQQVASAGMKVEVGPPELDVLAINGWTSCRINLKHQVEGKSWVTEVTFVNLNRADQMLIVTSAVETEFAEAQALADRLIRRWHEVLPEDESGIN